LARKVATLPEQIVRAGADEMRNSIVDQIKLGVSPDQTMSGFSRRRRTKLSATVKVTGGRAFATATVSASPRKAAAQWTIIESGTAERVVGQLRRKQPVEGGTNPPGGKHMNSGRGWRTGPWQAGRSQAKHVFEDGVRRGTADTERAMAELWERTVG